MNASGSFLSSLKKYWNERTNFNFLLSVLVIYIFVIIPLFQERVSGEILFFIFYFLLLSSGVPFLVKNRKTGILFLLIVTPFVLLFSELFFKATWVKVFADLFIVFYCICLGTIIMVRTFSSGHMTIHRVFGGIIVYLLLSFTFAMLYHTLFILNGPQTFHGLSTSLRPEFMYFSLSTLTTAAYGDITPINSLARSISNLESLTGQLYPSILIARLVSMSFTTSKAF